MKLRSMLTVCGSWFALWAAGCSDEHPAAAPAGNGSAAGVSGTGTGGAPLLNLGGGGSVEVASGGAPAGSGTTSVNGCDDSCKVVGTCDAGRCVIEDNAGKLSPEQRTALRAGGTGDAQFRWLYPYDQTVFPRGLLPPTLQFDGGAADAFYLHMATNGFDYQGFFGAADPARIQLSKPLWQALTSAAPGTDSVKVEVTKLRAGVATGPIRESWTIASGSLHGTIYYDSAKWMSGIPSGDELPGAARLKPGDAVAELAISQLSLSRVSADGSVLVGIGNGGLRVYDLRAGFSTPKEISGSFGIPPVLYPDGSLDLIDPEHFVDTKTGASVSASGWRDSRGFFMGSFSPDGRHFANDASPSTLVMMDFARGGNAFSNHREFSTKSMVDTPVFTPDARSIIYTELAGGPEYGQLSRVNTETGQVAVLDAANGRASGSENLYNAAPSALPVAAGGYYWEVFTSTRAYGNTLPEGAAMQLWVTALDISTNTHDSSHPAFYLEGQDAQRANQYAQWVLDPCQADGAACQSGDQCCGGYCRESAGKQQCFSMPPGTSTCSVEYEKCALAADCCDQTFECINGRCAAPPPVVK